MLAVSSGPHVGQDTPTASLRSFFIQNKTPRRELISGYQDSAIDIKARLTAAKIIITPIKSKNIHRDPAVIQD